MKVVVADLWPGRTAELAEVAPGVALLVGGGRQAAAAEAPHPPAGQRVLNTD
ncbi:MAG: HdeD family acid-resistance protein, partial [Gemmatimonadales bacterium]|nr:HdeD family acid-resistance protein [Gemmatimonadales bacterium]